MARSWYPHHMMQAKKILSGFDPVLDAYLYIVDARAPLTTFCPENLPEGKRIIVALNKIDLVEKETVKHWTAWFSNEYPVVTMKATDRKSCLSAAKRVKEIIKRKIVYLAVVGIPNVGKSMFIRNTCGSKIKTGTRPGVTTAVSWLKSKNSINLADTPGVLWPRMEGDEIFAKLCLINAVGERMVENRLTAGWLLEFLEKYPHILEDRYGMVPGDEISVNMERFSDKIGKKDEESVSKAIVRDFQTGRLGKLVLDEIPETCIQD